MSRKPAIYLLTMLFILQVITAPVLAAPQDMQASMQKAASFLNSSNKASQSSTSGWTALGLYGAGQPIDAQQRKISLDTIAGQWKDPVKNTVTTDLERSILTVLALGGDPADVQGVNLVQRLSSSQLPSGKFPDDLKAGGEELLNAHIWAIIALQSAHADGWDEKAAVKWLLDQQKPEGGYHFMAEMEDADADISANVLVALSLCTPDDSVKLSIEKLLAYLQTEQQPGGGFASMGSENMESTAAVIQGLIAIGENPAAWKKNGQDPVSALLAYQDKNGGFRHVQDGLPNRMSTEQALIALGDLKRGIPIYEEMKQSRSKENKGRFWDLQAQDPCKAAVEALASRGVINGYPDGSFRPQAPVSRAEFAVMLANAASLSASAQDGVSFSDVQQGHWAFASIQACAERKWLNGMGDGNFCPEKTITGAQVSAIVVQYADLPCRSLSGQLWYAPYVETAGEHKLLYPGFSPQQPATRAQCAWTIYALMGCQGDVLLTPSK